MGIYLLLILVTKALDKEDIELIKDLKERYSPENARLKNFKS
jgi:hypothetical protein